MHGSSDTLLGCIPCTEKDGYIVPPSITLNAIHGTLAKMGIAAPFTGPNNPEEKFARVGMFKEYKCMQKFALSFGMPAMIAFLVFLS
jgi:hypothetical protein